MKKPILIILILLLFLSIVGLAGLGYFILNKETFNENNTNEAVEQIESLEYYRANINDLILNTTNTRGRLRLMKLSLSLKSSDMQIENIIENNKAEFVDKIINLISSKTSDELHTLGGKNLFRAELKESFNKVINKLSLNNEEILQDSINKIFFTTFVIK